MSIIWKYLDKRSATINAIKDYDSMQFIILSTEEKLKQAGEDMARLTSPTYDGLPKQHNPQAGESHLAQAIDQIDVAKDRYRAALEYRDWFQPAWDQLAEDDQFVLESFYQESMDATWAVSEICEHFNIERSSAYNRKNRAISKLELLLFGKS